MSFLERLERFWETARRRTVGAALEALASQKRRRDEAAFSIALIALSAKMAKADGIVTDDEIDAFFDFFRFDAKDAEKVRMVFNLAQQDIAGFDEYVAKVARLYDDAPAVREDVLDCLFHIAAADGVAHPNELAMLERAAAAFRVPAHALHRMRAAHMGAGEDDPWLILGLAPGVGAAEAKAAYRALVREHHPDALIARGVPPNLVRIAERRMAAINDAYERLLAETSAKSAT